MISKRNFGKACLVYCCSIGLGLLLAVPVRPATRNQSAPQSKPAPDRPAGAKKSEPDSKKSELDADADGDAAARDAAAAELTRIQRGVSIIREAARDGVVITNGRGLARLQAQAAEAIWKVDTDNARELFEKAFETAINYYRESQNEVPEQLPSGARLNRADVRQEIIRTVSRLDPVLAKKMVERFIEEKRREVELAGERRESDRGPAGSTKPGNDRLMGTTNPAADQLLRIALELLGTDREGALELARRAIDLSVSGSAPSFLMQLSGRDRAAADQIFLYALSRIAREQPPVPGQLLMLAAYPFGEDRVYISDGGGTNSYGFGKPQKFDIDTRLIQAFFQRAIDVLTRASQVDTVQFPDLVPRVNSALFAARYLEPKVAQYQPDLSERWSALISLVHATATESSRDGVTRTLENMARENRSAGVDGPERIKNMLDRAEKTTDLAQRDELYAQAAQALRRAGEMTRALSIADKISDMEYRQAVRDWLLFDATNEAITARRLDEAQRYALDVSAVDQRAYLLFQIANMLFKDKDRARAIELLEQAARYATAADNTVDKVRALLGITSAYGAIDPVRAFELGTEAVKAASKIADYGPDHAFMYRVLRRKGGGFNSVSTNTAEAFDLGKTLAVLARVDFERTLALAQSIESKALQFSGIVAVGATLIEPKKGQ